MNPSIIRMGGWQGPGNIPGSAAPNMLIEAGAPLPYPTDAVPITGECSCLVKQRQAIFTPSYFMIAGSYENAELMPQDNGYTGDYASSYLYVLDVAKPYPYVLVG